MKTKKSKIWLSAGLSLALIGTAVGGFAAMETHEVSADASTVTVGSFESWDGYKISGSSSDAAENRTVITCVVAGYNRSLVYVEGVNSASQVNLGLTSDKDVAFQLTVFDHDIVETQYGTRTAALKANELHEESFTFSELASFGNATSCAFAFYFDTAATTPSGAKVTVNTLTVDGVSYTPAEYVVPPEKVDAPETSFKEYNDWTVTNGTKSACTLENLQGAEADGTVNNAAGTVTVENVANPVQIEIPLSEPLSAWPDDWTKLYVKVKATGITAIKGYIESVADDNLFCHNILKGVGSAWNTTDVPSVSEGFTFSTVDLSGYFTTFLKTGTISKIVLVPEVESGASAAVIEFGGMTFGKTAPTFINDVGTPEVEVGTWQTWSEGLTVVTDGELKVDDTTYQGLKLSWGSSLASGASACAVVSNFDAAKTPKLHLGFYTDSDIVLSVYHGNTCFAEQWKQAYTAGYHSFDIDVSEVSFTAAGNNEEYLYFYVDHGADLTGFEGTKNVVFDSIVFHGDLEIALGENASNGSIYQNIQTTATGISWNYDAAAAGAYWQINIPVNNWYSFNHRYLILEVSFSHDLKFGVYFDAAGGGTGGLIDHGAYRKGDYLLCLDTASLHPVDNSNLKLYFYCDVGNTSEVAVTKTVNVKNIRFSKEEVLSSPNAAVVEIDYAGRTISFDGEKYQVATTENFAEGTILQSGAAVTPGTALYVRAFEGEKVSAATKVELTATPLTAETAPAPEVTENMIRYTVQGYEFKMEGKDSEWKTLGSWGGLTAGTEYTVQIRKAATDSSFASEVVTVTITTKGDSGSSDTENKDKGGCKSSIAGGLGVGLAACCLAAGAAVFVVKKRKN